MSATQPQIGQTLFLVQSRAPLLDGGFGHFYAYAPTKIEYAIDRYAMEVTYLEVVMKRSIAQETLRKMGYLKVKNYGGIDQARKLLRSMID